ncbi:MAG: RNA polymerase sigma-70 factor [Gemmatimonadaceae bacterium]|nr:RNA polymerase sigma-70 factor [Gemmatimonadaceae bacterium]
MTAVPDGGSFAERPDPDDRLHLDVRPGPGHVPAAPSSYGSDAPPVRRVDAIPPRPVTIDDRALLAQLRAGEEGAFAVLFARYYDKLCAWATMYLGSGAEAEEVVEDVFVRVWEMREQLDIRTSLKAYLYTATRNHALNHVRRDTTYRRYLDDAWQAGTAPGMSEAETDLEMEAQLSDLARAIDDAIAQLPERCRQIFLLHRQHGLTYAEIAAAMEIAPKTVENQLGRALKLLRARLATFMEH